MIGVVLVAITPTCSNALRLEPAGFLNGPLVPTLPIDAPDVLVGRFSH